MTVDAPQTDAAVRAQIEDLERQLQQLVDADARDLVEAKLEELRRRLQELEATARASPATTT